MTINLFDEHAKEIHGIHDWRWYRWKAMPQMSERILYHELTGAVCTEVFKSGPRKGQTNWSKKDKSTVRTIQFTPDEHEAFIKRWEQNTGKCGKCAGEGKIVTGWSSYSGTKYAVCNKCGGDGSRKGSDHERD